MNNNISFFKRFRVYRHLSFLGILNHMFCNRLIKSKTLVANAPSLYKLSCTFPGKYLTNAIFRLTFNKLFTGGNSTEEVKRSAEYLERLNIPIVINFCAEGVDDDPKGQEILDINTKHFAKTMEVCKTQKNAITALKITGLVDINLLKKYNSSVVLRDKIWAQNSKDGKINGQDLFSTFQSLYKGINEEDFRDYLLKVHNFQGEPKEFIANQMEFKINHRLFFLYQPDKNSNLISRILLPLDQKQQQRILNFKKRLDIIIQQNQNDINCPRILVDAEQSYVQRAIECITEQMQQRYNKNRIIIIPTLQNYLKNSQKRLDYQIQFTKLKKLKFSVKLVRGAYLVEEARLSKTFKYQNPIVNCFEDTTKNYVQNFTKIILDSSLKGEIFAAGHNESTIRQLLEIKKQNKSTVQINFAQLFGLGDHLTSWLKSQRQDVYKLIPWAQTEVMVPYMMRRAQQLPQMRYPLDTQFKLLTHQLEKRLFNF